MRIMRRGAKSDHGVSGVELKNPKLKWNSTAEKFDVLFTGAATDFSTPSKHNYNLRFDPDELASLFSSLALEGAAMDSEEFAEAFARVLPAMTRIQMMASGIKLAA